MNLKINNPNFQRDILQLEFLLMNLSPCFDEATLPRWQLTSCNLDRFNSKDRRFSLIVCMKVGIVMTFACLTIHSNNNTKEATQLGHVGILLQPREFGLDTIARIWLNARTLYESF